MVILIHDTVIALLLSKQYFGRLLVKRRVSMGIENTPQVQESVICCEEVFNVDEKFTAKNMGSGEVDVLATPAMVAFMERVAMNCMRRFVPENHTSVGTRIEVVHLNPAPVGANIRVVARLKEIREKSFLFEVEAYWGRILVGKGVHERRVVSVSRFMEKVRTMTP